MHTLTTSQSTEAQVVPVTPRPLESARRRCVPLVLTASLVLALSLSVAFLSGWVPLDVPMMFEVCANLSGHWLGLFNPHNGLGRLFPMYWVWNCAQYHLFGTAVTPYLLVQAVLLLATAAMLCRMLRDLAGGRWSALLLAALYASIPLAENLSTMGKNEPTACFLMVGVALLFHLTRQRSGAAMRGACALAGPLFLLAVWSKETSIVLFVVPVAGAMLATALGRRPAFAAAARDRSAYLWLLAGLAGGYAASRLPFLLFREGVQGASYTAYEITPGLVMGNMRFYLEQQWDVVFFGAVAAALLLVLLVRTFRAPAADSTVDGARLLFVCCLAALGWAYWLGMQLWRWPLNYYMLLPDALFKFCALYAVLTLHRIGALGRLKLWALGTASALALLWGAVGALYIASTQVAYSRIYTAAMRQLPKGSASEGRLLLEPYPAWAEHVSGTERLVRNQLHLPLHVEGVGFLLDHDPAPPDVLKLMKMTEADLERARRAPLHEGDLLLTFTGSKLAPWSVRGVAPYQLPQSALEADPRYELQTLGEDRVTTPALLPRGASELPQWTSSFVGYKLSRVQQKQIRFEWTGRFADGWIGEHAKLTVAPAYGEPIAFTLRMERQTLPATIRILRDGQLWRELQVTTNEPITLEAGPAPQAPTIFEFECSRSFIPKEAGMNQDTRRLAAIVSLAPRGRRP